MNFEKRPLIFFIALGIAPIASAVIDFSQGELFEATCKMLFGLGIICFAFFFDKISPWKLFSLGLILLILFFLFLFGNYEYKQKRLLLTPHALTVEADNSCILGQRGMDSLDKIECECRCSGRYEDEPYNGLYDTKGLVGCKGTYWLCQGRPTGKILVTSP